MRPWLAICAAAIAAVAATGAFGGSAGGATGTLNADTCTNDERYAAPRLIRKGAEVTKLLCGSFTGRGSRSLVVSYAFGGRCPGKTAYWGVWSYTGGDPLWAPVLGSRLANPSTKIKAAEGNIRESWVTYLGRFSGHPADDKCGPYTGATKSTLWTWHPELKPPKFVGKAEKPGP